MKLLTKEERERLREAVRDPAEFATRFLGVKLWAGQAEILRSIQANQRTAIKACHASGKTFVLAIGVLWWLARYEDWIVLTISPTRRQVVTQLWPKREPR